VLVGAFTWSDGVDLALAIFLVVVGLALAFAFLQLADVIGRVSGFIRRTEHEVLPLIHKVGGTVERVNTQLDKVDQVTTSAVDAVAAVDRAVRAVSAAVAVPVQKLSGLVSGVGYGASSFRAHRDWSGAVQAGKEAAKRREQDLAEELRPEE
jgi:uncharacterized protein YoxC